MGTWDPARFDHTDNECARNRYVIAAHHLRECVHIIEIGGVKTTIDQFVTYSFESITVIDPFIKPGTPHPRVTYVDKLYQDYDYTRLLSKPGKKGLMILDFMLKKNLEWEGPNDNLVVFKKLVHYMDVVILDSRKRDSAGYHNFEVAGLIAEQEMTRVFEFDFQMMYDSEIDKHPDPGVHQRFYSGQNFKVFKR